MKTAQVLKTIGEWTGTGTMTVGNHVGAIVEYMRVEPTDIADCVLYVRKSRINFKTRSVLHNETGYIRPDSVQLMLSRGSYIIMEWKPANNAYEQVVGSPDSRNMIRTISFQGTTGMTWDNVMDVRRGNRWATHTANTAFVSVT